MSELDGRLNGNLLHCLGFGCSGIGSSISYRQSCRLLERAYSLGIRHFDTAPVYGNGRSERILGDVFGAANVPVNIVTKVGIARPRHSWVRQLGRAVLGPAKRAWPRAWAQASRSVSNAMENRGQFDTAFVRSSVSESLELLRQPSVHAVLLHEVGADQASVELEQALVNFQKKGLCRHIGLATSLTDSAAILAHANRYDWIQVNHYWGGFSDQWLPAAQAGVRATHRVLRSAVDLPDVKHWPPLEDAELAARIGHILADPSAQPLLLLRAALLQNRAGPVLVSTSRLDRLEQLVHVARIETDDSLAHALNRWMAKLASKSLAPQG